jgi:hypothetical protein
MEQCIAPCKNTWVFPNYSSILLNLLQSIWSLHNDIVSLHQYCFLWIVNLGTISCVQDYLHGKNISKFAQGIFCAKNELELYHLEHFLWLFWCLYQMKHNKISGHGRWYQPHHNRHNGMKWWYYQCLWAGARKLLWTHLLVSFNKQLVSSSYEATFCGQRLLPVKIWQLLWAIQQNAVNISHGGEETMD